MSMEGIRMLAKALEESRSRGVSDVYVHSEGRIDALGKTKENARKVITFTFVCGHGASLFATPAHSSWRFCCIEKKESQ